MLRPEGGGVYQIIFRYRGPTEHQTWMDSEQPLLAQIDELLDDHTSAEVRSVDGWEGWFVRRAMPRRCRRSAGRWP